MNPQLKNRLDQVSDKIRKSQTELEGVWFDFGFGNLNWKRRADGGPFAIHYDEKPLMECPFEIRLNVFPRLDSFVLLVLREAHLRLDEKVMK